MVLPPSTEGSPDQLYLHLVEQLRRLGLDAPTEISEEDHEDLTHQMIHQLEQEPPPA